MQPRRTKTLLLTALLGLGWTAGIVFGFGLRSLFAPGGHFLCSGGITDCRGHAGDEAGQLAIESLLNNVKWVGANIFVFGCALADRSQKRDKARCLK